MKDAEGIADYGEDEEHEEEEELKERHGDDKRRKIFSFLNKVMSTHSGSACWIFKMT